jgi:hypothetical protein
MLFRHVLASDDLLAHVPVLHEASPLAATHVATMVPVVNSPAAFATGVSRS